MTDQFSFKKVFAAACMGMLMFGIIMITLGSILPSLVEKFQLNEFDAGALTSVLPLGILLGSLLFGPIVDRHSYKHLLVVCSLIIIAGMEGIAYTDSLFMLHGSLLVIGIGGGAINGGTNALVADISGSGAKRRSANLSFLGVFFGFGALGMPLLLAVLSQDFSYFHIISVIGLLLLLPVIYFFTITFPQAKQKHSVPIARSFQLVKDTNLVLLGLVLFFQSGIEGIVNNWSTLYLINESNFIQDNALFALSIFVLSLTLTRIWLTFLLNHVRSYRVLIISVISTITGILIIMVTSVPNREIIGLALLGAGLAAGFPVILSYVGALYPHLSGTAFSLVLVIALVGNILFNLAMGLVSNSYGIGVYPPLVLLCITGMAATLMVTLKRISKDTYI
jgi:fucose permease